MKNLIEFLSNHSVNYAFTSGILLTVLIIAIACIIILYLRLKEAKTSLKKSAFYKYVSADTIDSYESQIKLQECEIAERKKYFEDAIVEITKLTSENKQLEANDAGYADHLSELKEENRENAKSLKLAIDVIESNNLEIESLNTQIKYWRERALHQKHTKKVVVESEWYECIDSAYYPYFAITHKYKFHNKPSHDAFMYLINEYGNYNLVERKHFKPVQK